MDSANNSAISKKQYVQPKILNHKINQETNKVVPSTSITEERTVMDNLSLAFDGHFILTSVILVISTILYVS